MTARLSRRALLAATATVGLAGCRSDRLPAGPGGTAPDPSSTTLSLPDDARPSSPTPAPPARLAWGPSVADVEDATAEAGEMPLRLLVGQLIVARYDDTSPATPARLVRELGVGGVILLAKNIVSFDQVRATTRAVRDASSELGRGWPSIISVDNEGGLVQRLSGATGPWTSFPAFAAAGGAVRAGDGEVVRAAMRALALELRATGFTVDWAPVADVTVGAADAAIRSRSAGRDPKAVAEAVSQALRGLEEGGVLGSLKHFPGHGALTVDSHHGLPVLDRSVRQLERRELVPFRAGIDAGAPTVMLGHILVPRWDDRLPASLSPTAYRLLRDQLGFTGVTVTDGLDMGAVTAGRTTGQIAVAAARAGADLLLSPTDARVAHAAVVHAVKAGDLRRDGLERAAGRVIAMMRWQRVLARRSGPTRALRLGEARDEAAALAAYL